MNESNQIIYPPQPSMTPLLRHDTTANHPSSSQELLLPLPPTLHTRPFESRGPPLYSFSFLSSKRSSLHRLWLLLAVPIMADVFSVPVFFIVFRECIETVIIVSVLLAFLKQSLDGPSRDPVVYKKLRRQVSARIMELGPPF